MPLETHLDYETYSDLDLKVVGMWAYARHPSTRILCVSWATGNEEPHAWWAGQSDPLALFKAFKEHDLYSFRPFELAITEEVASKMGWPVPKREQWNDVAAVARMCALPPALDRLAKALKLKEQKDESGKKLINMFSKPQFTRKRGLPPTKFIIHPEDRPDDFKRFVRYCKQDVRSEREAHHAMPIQKLPPYEQRVWLADVVINERGVKIDRAMAEGAMKLVRAAKDAGGKDLSNATNGVVTSAGQGKRILVLAHKLGRTLANLKKETVTAVLADDECPPLLRKVLELRDETNITSVQKFAAMLRTADLVDDRVRDAHEFHAAGPGRWGGRIVQTQNLPRPVLKLGAWEHHRIRKADYLALKIIHGDILPVLRDAIRNAIIAKDGHDLFVVDKASIEARVLGWVAGCKGYQKAFKEDKDLYIVCAEGIFGVPYDKIKDGYKRDVREFVEYRKTGKDSVLALGYGQGDGTRKDDTGGFLAYCLKKGGKMTPALAKKTVHAYRKILFPEIPRLWYETEACAVRCVRSGQRQTMGGDGERPLIVFEMIKGYLTIKLPSGRRLWYPQAHVKNTVDKWGNVRPQVRFFGEYKKRFWRVEWTYGGKIVENIIQAIARDLLARAILKCEAAGLPVVMHIHDEIVAEVARELGISIDIMHAIFRSVPGWGKGLLLGSGGFVSPFYRK